MSEWALLRVQAQSQNKYCEFMGQYFPNLELYFPCYERKSRPSGTRWTRPVLCPVYPGYVFADIRDEESVWHLLSGPVKAWFVKFGGRVELVPDRVIERLRDMEKSGQLVQEVVVDNPYKPGRVVRVHMPVASITAVLVMCVNSNRAIVDGPLGRISVPIHQLELG